MRLAVGFSIKDILTYTGFCLEHFLSTDFIKTVFVVYALKISSVGEADDIFYQIFQHKNTKKNAFVTLTSITHEHSSFQ